MLSTLDTITFSEDKEKQQTFSEFRRNIGVNIVIPQITLSHLNAINKTSDEYKNSISYKLRKTPAALHYVMYHGRETPIIIFSYGFIYLGKDDSVIFKNDEWKVIWFENITGIAPKNNKDVTLIVKIPKTPPEKNSEKPFIFKSCEGHNFDDFRSTLEAALTIYSHVRFIPNKYIVDAYIAKKSGGRRKTKRSKRSKRTIRNKRKVCKRRTRRS